MESRLGAAPRVKVVGRRGGHPDPWQAVAALQTTAEALRGTPAIVPRGVYRFRSFDEAQRWLLETIARTHARHARKTSRASAAR